MKTYGSIELYFHAFLTSALDRGEWSASCPDRFTSKEMAPSTNWMGMGPEPAWTDIEAKIYLHLSYREVNCCRSVRSPVTIVTELPWPGTNECINLLNVVWCGGGVV
jgi:hypothetical protein